MFNFVLLMLVTLSVIFSVTLH